MTEFNLSRRGFLKAAIAGATAAAISSPAFALVKDQFITDVEKLIRLHDELVGMVDFEAPKVQRSVIHISYDGREYNTTIGEWKLRVSKETFDTKFNEVIEHVNKFAVPEKNTPEYELALSDTRKVFDRDTKQSFRDIPPTLCPAAIAISAVRSLLAVHMLKMDPSKMPAFETFADKYKNLILAS